MKQRQFASLTTRIGLLFAAIAMVTFNAVGAYLCRSLETELQARDDVDLHEKITHIRHLLEETPSGEFIDQNPSRFIDAAAGHEGMLLVLKNKEGAILMQNTAEASRLPQLRIAAVDMALDNAAIQSWTLPSGTPARVASAWGRVGKGTDEKVQIIVAQSTAARMALLASHERTVTIAVMIGALLAGLLGYLITRAGLNPIRRLAHQAHTITAQRLDTRLDAATAPRELQTLIEAFNAMLDRLHESFQQLSQFSADLAHDIRTPINNLMVQTQVALSQPRPVDEYQTLLVSNIEEYERLARMIESMLFLARADHAHVAPSSQSVDIHTELQRVAEYFEGVAEEANVALTVEAAGTLRADTALFRRAVNNLVANAIRHASPGTQITLAAERLDEMVAVKVSNRGAAIDPVHLPRLFDRFYRADQSRTDSSSSTGLGLSIVHSIMKMHGGRVDVSSESDITTFRLLFPH
ncbi:MAG TPA: heavy metal sensor histidine kinase [Burkholderiaceae bacterium]|nr:heavy metal sensor histidine kinase [Burkholderiaceae bacterium]